MSEKTKEELDEECLEIAREFWRADFRRRVNIVKYFLFGEPYREVLPDPPTPMTEGDE
jgi:hypothetical protein